MINDGNTNVFVKITNYFNQIKLNIKIQLIGRLRRNILRNKSPFIFNMLSLRIRYKKKIVYAVSFNVLSLIEETI